ncbi:recombinase family protein [Paenibacillus wynnii]|uniref:recombinase family protein n=1 Tax=Paenibacillus wynnii TaxID=268407 RepID=UPI0027920813|nr:recombinase family protein [Paenibacillus wynnii]MDQ0195310.1 DNA invertase Pin-like site-specific DNA recombinase [Paenibacillus wynnii]
MLIGYMRPYQDDPNYKNQINQLSKVPCDTLIAEDHSSAKRRVKLEKMMTTLKPGDKIVITKLFAIADSTRHLVELLDILNSQHAYIHSISEGIDTSNSDGYSFSDIVKYLVDFQSDVTSENTKRGLSEAKEKGHIPGRPRKADENVKRAIIMYQSKEFSLAEIKEETGISKSTLYRYLEN